MITCANDNTRALDAFDIPFDKVRALAENLDDFFYDFDPYEYQDRVGDQEENILEIEACLRNGDISGLIEYLTEIIEDEPNDEAQYLIDRIKKI